MSDEWPKPWDEITEATETYPGGDGLLVSSLGYNMIDLGPLRAYEGTVYINADGGREGENGDEWLPLGVYLSGETA